MTCWNFLELTPTVDTRAIKRSYARKLKQYHPEDDAEGFKKLRQAYEEALEQSRYLSQNAQTNNTEEPTDSIIPDDNDNDAEQSPSDNTPDDELSINAEDVAKALMDKLVAVYADFEKRADTQAWKAVFDDDSLWNLEVKQHMFFWLFDFISRHPFVPAHIYSLMKQHFYWHENHEILARNFDEQHVEKTLGIIEQAAWGLSYENIKFPQEMDINAIEQYFSQRNYLDYLVYNNEQDKALALLEEMNFQQIRDPELNRLLINLSLENKRTDDALTLCDKSINENPQNIDAYLHQAKILFGQKKYSEVANAFRGALKINDNHAIALRGLATCYFKTGNILAAKSLYEQAIEALPFDIEARIQIMRINQILIQQSLDALELDNKNEAHILQLAEAYLEIGAFDECIDFVEQHIHEQRINTHLVSSISELLADPENSLFNAISYDLNLISGHAYSGLNNKALAQRAYANALIIAEAENSNGYDALVKLASLHIDNDQYHDALEKINIAMSLSSDNAHLYHLLSETQRYLSDYENALISSDKAINLDASHWVYYSTRALILINLNKHEPAISDLDIVLDNQPDYAWGWHRKGLCLNRTSQYEQAIPCFESAMSFNTSLTEPCLELARAACQTGDVEKAISAIETYTSNNGEPSHAAYWQERIEKLKSEQTANTHSDNE